MSHRRATFLAFLAAAGLATVVACRPAAEPAAPTAAPGDSATAPATAALPAGAVPSGVIVAFYGTVVPEGWVLCDGRTTARGVTTPDLRNRFIFGLDPATGAVGERGGAASHTHTARTGGPREKDEKIESGDDEHAANDGHTHEVSVDAAQHLPPYVKLAYIMKE